MKSASLWHPVQKSVHHNVHVVHRLCTYVRKGDTDETNNSCTAPTPQLYSNIKIYLLYFAEWLFSTHGLQ